MKYNIHTFGARGITTQIERIEEGFSFYGHSIDFDKSPDFIYANDIGSWDEALISGNSFNNCKIILNLLDLPKHLNKECSRQVEKIKKLKELEDKNIIFTCISYTVKSDMEKMCGVSPHVIYNPIKDFEKEDLTKLIPFLVVGRNCDPHKRVQLLVDILRELGKISQLYVVGEDIGFGNYLGRVPDEKLSKIYSLTKFVWAGGKNEGLGLPAFEGASCGAIPIVLDDCSIAEEFWYDCLFSSNREELKKQIQDDYFVADIERKVKEKDFSFLKKEQVAKNIIEIFENE